MICDYDVAIIGAGAAGIGAARKLAGQKISTIMMEASSRAGGRAWTQELNGNPIDLGCGYLHSGDRNPWTALAQASGFHVDRREPAWHRQFKNLGFSQSESAAADSAFSAWESRLPIVSSNSDCAADALDPDCEWNAFLQAMSGYLSGAELEHISIADYLAYDTAASNFNWRVAEGYGTLIASALPPATSLHLSTPVTAIDLQGPGIKLTTRTGTLRVRYAIITVSTAVLAGSSIRLPAQLDPWRHAAACLPLGHDEKYFLEIIGWDPFTTESHVIANPRDPRTGTYYIRPFGRPIIECFTGGAGAQMRNEAGQAAAFAIAIDELAALFGADVRRHLRPLACSSWSRSDRIGGAYSHALPGRSVARAELARSLDERLFFAGEATNTCDFSTAHGAYESGQRAAEEVMAAHRPSRLA